MATNILFVHYGDDWIRGSERTLLDLTRYLQDRKYRPFVWTNNRTLAKQLDLMGIDTELSLFTLMFGWKEPKFDFANWKALIKQGCELIENNNIELIHINSAAPCQWMIAAARIKNVPLVTQVHSDYPARDRLTLGVHLSPHIISVSHFAARSLIQDGYSKSRLSIIHNGIDTRSLLRQAEVNVREKLNIAKHDFVFATVGSLIHRKGVDRILTAMRYVLLEHPNIQLVVVGDGPQKQHLIDQADYLHLSDRIHFIGEQTNVVGWLKGCDAMVSGARSEAFGLVLAEAALAMIPVIAPFEGGIPEFIKHGQNGILYPNHRYAPLAKAMSCVVNRPQLNARLAKAAYRLITEQYDINHSFAKVERVYQHLLSKPCRSNSSIFSTLLPIKTHLSNRLTLVGEHHG